MKLFSFILSVVVFFISLYFFVIKITEIDSLNDVIYVSLLIVLMAICVLGVIINGDIFKGRGSGTALILFIGNTFSKRK